MTTASSQILPGSAATDFTSTSFIVAAALAEMQTVSVCEVMAVNTGALTVDVKVLVNLMTAAGQSIPHGVIAGRPYFRLQGGGSGIICDPVVGDIGTVVFASRDLSGVIANKGAANPGSQRQFDWADGIYFGGILNSAPTQYMQFLASGGGINIVSPGTVAIQAPATTASGTLNVAGNTTLQATLAVTGTSVLTGGVSAPGGITVGAPTGGTAAPGTINATGLFVNGVAVSTGGGGGSGTVTSVGISTPGIGVVVSGGPITVSGTLTVDLSSTTYAALALAVTALQSISIATGTGLTGGPLTASGTTVALNSTTLAALALATSALQSISIATGTGLTGGPLTASGTTVALSAGSIASLALANTAVQPGTIQFVLKAQWNATNGAPPLSTVVPQDLMIPYACTLQEVYIDTQGGTGSCTIGLTTSAFPITSPTDITGGVSPAISSGTSYSNAVLSGWTTSFAQAAMIRATLTACSGFTSVTAINIYLRFK